MTGWTEDDAVMADLRNWLLDRGYVVLSDEFDSDNFGNQAVTMARPIALRLARDRGQWAVEACGTDGQWRWLGDWLWALGRGRPRSTSAVEEADLVHALLDEIERRPDAADGK